MSSLKHTLEISAAHKEAFEAGKQAAYNELIELFKDIPMWGSVAVYKIKKLKNKNSQGEN